MVKYIGSFSSPLTFQALHTPHTQIDMDDDSLRCILEHTYCMNARRHTRPLEARLAVGGNSNVEVSPWKVVDANGIIGSKETILFDVTPILGSNCGMRKLGGYPVWASQMVKPTRETQNPGDLVFVDTLGDDAWDVRR